MTVEVSNPLQMMKGVDCFVSVPRGFVKSVNIIVEY